MKHNKWLIRLCIVLLILLFIAILFFAYSYWDNYRIWNSPIEQTEIQGFSKELLDALESRYNITIPKEAHFVKGYNIADLRDSYVAILFECPINEAYQINDHSSEYVKQLLKLGTRYSEASKDTPQFIGADWYEELCGQMGWMLNDKSLDYTYISYNIESNKLVIRFIGWRPGATFK